MLLDPEPDQLKKILDLIESYLDPVCKILKLAFSICSYDKNAFCPILHEQCLVSEVTSDSLSSITINRRKNNDESYSSNDIENVLRRNTDTDCIVD